MLARGLASGERGLSEVVMGIEENKAVVREWVRRWNLNDAHLLGELYSDKDFDWRISGLSPVSAQYDKSTVVELMAQTFAVEMNRPLHFELESLTAEDDRVSFEGVGSGEFKNGAEFKNFYHILMTIRNGKIVRGRAYFDTYTASRSPLQSSLDESQKLR